MAKNSKIEWTNHTFNPWWGCSRVSPACDHCYAETWAKRVGQDLWGKEAPRRFFGDTHWSEPLKWQKEAKQFNERRRVFCASMADVFEDRSDLDSSRLRLWQLIERTPNLDWLILTKRPQKIKKLSPWAEGAIWPPNIWLGTTVENQKFAKLRLPHLLKHKTSVHFVSCEPLLGHIDLSEWLLSEQKLNWIIAGGESGPGARPMDPEWARSLRDQAKKHKAAFHFKQWGHWSPLVPEERKPNKTILMPTGANMGWQNKKNAGRELDGCVHNEFPIVKVV